MSRTDARRALGLPILRSRLAPIFLRRARRLGVDTRDASRRFRVPIEAAEVSIGLDAFQDLASELAEQTHDALFGFHAALESDRGDFGVFEYVARNAPTMRGVLERMARYGHSINAQVRVRFDGATGCLTESIPGVLGCLGRHGNDFAVAHKVKIGRELLGERFVPAEVFFAHAAPPKPQRQELSAWFRGSELAYGADHNGLRLSPELLDLPIDHADPVLLQVLEGRLGEIAGQLEELDSVEVLRRAVADDLAAADSSGVLLASRLGVSKRTLHRRLAAAGLTLRMVIEHVRREMALAFLADHDRPIADIAERLGYSDGRAFTRAFVRWTGATPLAYRKELGSGGAIAALRSGAPRR